MIHTAIFAEAAVTPGGFVIVDFLSGTMTGAYLGGELEEAAPLLHSAFPAFCAKHGVDFSDYSMCLVRFVAARGGNSHIITVEDRSGLHTASKYVGMSGRRSKELDDLGRLRPKPET